MLEQEDYCLLLLELFTYVHNSRTSGLVFLGGRGYVHVRAGSAERVPVPWSWTDRQL